MAVGTYTPPAISVSFDGDSYVLMATSHGRTATAGERLLRSTPHPAISWSHDSEAAAERDAAILRAYLAECATGKKKDAEPVVSLRNYWQD